jgi:hypothetical protein
MHELISAILPYLVYWHIAIVCLQMVYGYCDARYIVKYRRAHGIRYPVGWIGDSLFLTPLLIAVLYGTITVFGYWYFLFTRGFLFSIIPASTQDVIEEAQRVPPYSQ